MAAPVLDSTWTLEAACAELDQRLAASTAPASDEQLLAAARSVQALRNRLAAYEYALIAELDARGVAGARGVQDTAAMLAGLLHIARGEAGARVRAARNLGPRQRFGTGEPLDPAFPQAAAALAAGTISDRHA